MEELKELAPDYLNGQYLLARCYMALDRPQAVRNVLGSIIEREPDSSIPVIELGNYYYDRKQYKEARDVYEAYLKRHPDDVICSNNLANILADGNIFLERALELAQQNYDRDNANPIYADALGWVLTRLERPNEAIPLLLIAVRGIPGHPEPHYHLGRAYLELGDKKAAKKEFNTALRLSKQFAGIDDTKALLTELLTEDP